MNDKNLICIIILLSSIAVGMIVGLIVTSNNKEYHGPNAEKQSQKIFYYHKTGKCLRFGIKLLDCPPPKSKLMKIIDKIKKI